MPGHMKELLKQVDSVIAPKAPVVRPKMQGTLFPPKPAKLTPKQAPKKKESPYKFL